MTKIPLFALVILGCSLGMAAPQSPDHHFPTPPEPLNTEPKNDVPATLPRHIDLKQLQKEADDLARTAQTIPTDVASVRKGMLPKDVIEKLKQIEKMSKHLRSELNP